jgi:hypothetical protein
MATIKDFIVDYGDGKSSVDVTSEHTLADVRRLMYEDWDDDMLPDQDVEWAFWVFDSGIRIPEKQESRKKAWNFIGKDVRIRGGIDKNCKMNKNKNKRRPAVDASSNTTVKTNTNNNNHHHHTNKNHNHNNKRQKIVSDVSAATGLQSAAVSPDETALQPARTNHPSWEHENEETASEVHGSGSSSSSHNVKSHKLVTNHNGNGRSSSSSDEEMSPVALLKKLQQVATPTRHDDNDVDNVERAVPMANGSKDKEDPEGEAPLRCTAAAADIQKKRILVAKSRVKVEDDSEDDSPVFVSMHEDDTDKLLANDNDNDDDDEENAEQDEEEMQDVATPENDENPHKKADEALDKSLTVLRRMESILKEHEYFCNQAQRDEWMTELQTLFQNERPQTVIGVLGSTGV